MHEDKDSPYAIKYIELLIRAGSPAYRRAAKSADRRAARERCCGILALLVSDAKLSPCDTAYVDANEPDEKRGKNACDRFLFNEYVANK